MPGRARGPRRGRELGLHRPLPRQARRSRPRSRSKAGRRLGELHLDFGAYHGEDVARRSELDGVRGHPPVQRVPRAERDRLRDRRRDRTSCWRPRRIRIPHSFRCVRRHRLQQARAGTSNSGGPEIGDLCKLESDGLRPAPAGFAAHRVQRMWSERSLRKAAGHEPCVPNVPDAGPVLHGGPGARRRSTLAITCPGSPWRRARAVRSKCGSRATLPRAAPTVSGEKARPQAPVDPDNLLVRVGARRRGRTATSCILTITRKATRARRTSTGSRNDHVDAGGASNSFWTLWANRQGPARRSSRPTARTTSSGRRRLRDEGRYDRAARASGRPTFELEDHLPRALARVEPDDPFGS